MNAFSKPTGPSLFSKRELSNAQKQKPQPLLPGLWASRVHPFCTQLPSQAAQDRSNSIKGRT